MKQTTIKTKQIQQHSLIYAFLLIISFIFTNCDLTNTNIEKNNGDPIDGDKNTYETISINDQVWMTENLKTTKYNDGIAIPNIIENEDWKTFGIGDGYCWYQNDEEKYKTKYGALYNWQSLTSEKLCPTGWHVPSREEWLELYNYLDKNGYHDSTGIALKSIAGWVNQWGKETGNGIDLYGFNGVPAGARTELGAFTNSGMSSSWWSDNESSKGFSYSFSLSYAHKEFSQGTSYQACGRSVRCIKDY